MHGFSLFKKSTSASSTVSGPKNVSANDGAISYVVSDTIHIGERILLQDVSLETRYQSAHRSRSTPDNIIQRRESSYKSFTSALSNQVGSTAVHDNTSHLAEDSVIVLSNY